MGNPNEKTDDTVNVVPATVDRQASFDEKEPLEDVARRLNATVEDILGAREKSTSLSLEETKKGAEYLVAQHSLDANFPRGAIERLEEFLANEDIFAHPESHLRDISEARVEVYLLTTNSPYAEVRAVVEPYDDPSLPVSTIRSWTIGLVAVIFIAFINQLFSVRQPSITISSEIVQLLSYPVGKAAERWLPDVGVTVFGVRHSLNPGPFNKKEHMLISIMANVGKTLPSSRYIIFTTWMDKYFGRAYAKSFGYQILLALSTDLMGCGLAGICRRFLVYPSYAVWPASLVTIALNSSLHHDANNPVMGPFNKIWNASRYRFFMVLFASMFVYFWFPGYLFSALSVFNWLAWIAPNNFNLVTITGMNKGLGLNPLPTFDWNIVTHSLDPLVVPFRVTLNTFVGTVVGGITLIGIYYTNAFSTAYLPMLSSGMFTHTGKTYNVSAILDSRTLLDEAKYQAYSPVYMGASNIVMYYFSFSVYAAVVTYAYLYHRHDIVLGFRSLFKSLKGSDTYDFKDVHSRLMNAYKEVPEWWFAIVNVVAIVFGVAAVAAWPTNTNVGVVFFGILLALIFVIPTGVIYATTGMEIQYNILAEFIGGAWQPGNALAMNYFKCFGVVTTMHALYFSNDNKLAHYMKYRNDMSSLPSDQSSKFTCPGVNVYFTASVFFGTLGARKVFGKGAIYPALLSAFPVGFAVPIIFYFFQRKLPRTHWAAKIHPVMLLNGASLWTAPYNFAYHWPAVIPGWLSMVYLRQRYLAFWSKYNFVLSAAFSSGMAISALIIFFAVSYKGFEVNWWGNSADTGCEATACVLKTLPKGEYFGPRIGTYA